LPPFWSACGSTPAIPHRLGRHAATAFWLHMLAAPALVNTVALTLYNSGGGRRDRASGRALVVITLLALVIDRRSFLTAAIAYIALVIAWVMGDSGDFGTWTFILIALGGLHHRDRHLVGAAAGQGHARSARLSRQIQPSPYGSTE
jgi:hypothetical protein